MMIFNVNDLLRKQRAINKCIYQICALAISSLAIVCAVPVAVLACSLSDTVYTAGIEKNSIDFTFIQAGAKGSGRFEDITAYLTLTSDKSNISSLEVSINVDSLDTDDDERDDLLRSNDFFDVANYPNALFTSTEIYKTIEGFDAKGQLTIRGITLDMTVPFTFKHSNSLDNAISYLLGEFTIKRLDFGVGQGDWKTDAWVGNNVTLSYALIFAAESTK